MELERSQTEDYLEKCYSCYSAKSSCTPERQYRLHQILLLQTYDSASTWTFQLFPPCRQPDTSTTINQISASCSSTSCCSTARTTHPSAIHQAYYRCSIDSTGGQLEIQSSRSGYTESWSLGSRSAPEAVDIRRRRVGCTRRRSARRLGEKGDQKGRAEEAKEEGFKDGGRIGLVPFGPYSCIYSCHDLLMPLLYVMNSCLSPS